MQSISIGWFDSAALTTCHVWCWWWC